MTPHELANYIKEKASVLGFFDCGIAKADHLDRDAVKLKQWLDSGYQAEMHYMERNFEKRTDPRLLVGGAKSVILLLYNYFPTKELSDEGNFRISKYAYGNDYHDVIRQKLNILCDELLKIDSKAIVRGFVDSAPVLERAWATLTGLGWIGKNSMLITRKHGSFFFLAEVITSLEPEYDEPFGGSYCGDCSRCMVACPTQAIVAPGVVDARRCISFLTIENKGEIPEPYRGKYDQWIFGCDCCQDVCPWNHFSTPHSESEFASTKELTAMQSSDWMNLDEAKFTSLFRHSAVKRCKFEGMKRNIEFVNFSKTVGNDMD